MKLNFKVLIVIYSKKSLEDTNFSLLPNKHSLLSSRLNTSQSSSSCAAWSSPGSRSLNHHIHHRGFYQLVRSTTKTRENGSLKETALEKDKSKDIISQGIHFWHHRKRVPSENYKTRKNIKLDPTRAAGLASAEGRWILVWRNKKTFDDSPITETIF